MTDQPTQRGLEWVRAQTDPMAIDRALAAGELADVLAGRDPDARPPEPLTTDQLAGMTAADLVERAQRDPDLARRIGATTSAPAPIIDQGARGPKPTSILDGKTPEQTRAMLRNGDLDALLRGET